MPHAFAYPGAFPKKRSTENGNSREVRNSAENDGFISTTIPHILHEQVAGSEDCNPPASAPIRSQTVREASRRDSEQSQLSSQSDTSTVPQSIYSQSSTAARAAWRRSVEVWREGGLGQAKKLSHISAVFDTGCEKFNWVSKRVIDRLDAGCLVATDIEVRNFDGRTLRISFKTRLCFKDPNNGGSYEEEFLVLESADSPFDLLLGQKWCYVNGVIAPAILGLATLKSTPADKKEKKKRDKEYKDEKAENECARKLAENRAMARKETQAEEVGESSRDSARGQ
ncbi:uncharacterized protein PAC_06435 [Phialocephala subalpina]|uniref:Uncharacterized protein n=1 Tax=Phialocephala subalpina TaxID=576137 RepID=A0A1L7WUT6_9HELO|nr:uncharacterized protein PAC_06435 [Phialocephala subalpina]